MNGSPRITQLGFNLQLYSRCLCKIISKAHFMWTGLATVEYFKSVRSEIKTSKCNERLNVPKYYFKNIFTSWTMERKVMCLTIETIILLWRRFVDRIICIQSKCEYTISFTQKDCYYEPKVPQKLGQIAMNKTKFGYKKDWLARKQKCRIHFGLEHRVGSAESAARRLGRRGGGGCRMSVRIINSVWRTSLTHRISS